MNTPLRPISRALAALACLLAAGCANEIHVTGTQGAEITGAFTVGDQMVHRTGTVPVDIELPARHVHEYTIRKARKEDSITVVAMQDSGQSITVQAPPGSAGVVFTQTKPGCWSSELLQ